MTRYYRDLHDRELLSQGESVLAELHRRRLLDVLVSAKGETDGAEPVHCPVDSIERNGAVLSVVVDRALAGR